jgi:hypothetical protein
MEDKYLCKDCGAEAFIGTDNKIIRTCDHDSTIILDLHVEVFGESNIQ